MFFGPDFFIWGDYQTIRAYRVAPGGDHADPLAQRGLVGWKGMWGLKLNEFDGTPAMGPASNIEGQAVGAGGPHHVALTAGAGPASPGPR